MHLPCPGSVLRRVGASCGLVEAGIHRAGWAHHRTSRVLRSTGHAKTGASRACGVPGVALAIRKQFAYRQTMNANDDDVRIAGLAGAIAEPARARMLRCLLDGHARTGTELATVGGVTASTASVHLGKLVQHCLLRVAAQGRHRYYSLASAHVATALEALTVLAGGHPGKFEPHTPNRLRAARTCYDHMAGALAVALHDRMFDMRWLAHAPERGDAAYSVTRAGDVALRNLGVDLDAVRAKRRRFACGCLDWSERRPHLAGALGAALLDVSLAREWVMRDLDSRALELTPLGKREMRARFNVELRAT